MNLTWVSGFNGGLEQVFIVSIRSDFGWKNVANLTDPGEGKVVYFETKHLKPGQTVWYRLESCNEINCSIHPAEIEIRVKGILFFMSQLYTKQYLRIKHSILPFPFL